MKLFKWSLLFLIVGYLLVAMFYRQKEVVTIINVGKDTTWNFTLHKVIPLQFDYPYYVYIDGELDEEVEVDFSFTVENAFTDNQKQSKQYHFKYALPKGKVKKYYMIEYANPETSHFIPEKAKKGHLTFTYTTGYREVEKERLMVDYKPLNDKK
ncbi:hypothetical protein [Runella salmonicolor]|uniref:YxeA family protein n=1 Tax=Runella salmonicolor TaxID=2950278 RepID=A0ABT1FGN9_9BACT|nr:hypothetical protein [Runella salmonicolor]MCP1380925.1 hypothetical protein [Runella salmonicolor]